MIPLNTIQVPKPCGENWDAMDGDAQRRFCAGCGCHVHDLSAMTAPQAQDLLDKAEGRLCVRFQTKPDGTVLTQSEVALVSERRVLWPRRLAAAASWVLAVMLTGLGLTAHAETTPRKAVHPKAKPHAAPIAPKFPRTMGIIALPMHTLPHPTPEAPKTPTVMGDVAAPTILGTPAPIARPPVMGKIAVVPPSKRK